MSLCLSQLFTRNQAEDIRLGWITAVPSRLRMTYLLVQSHNPSVGGHTATFSSTRRATILVAPGPGPRRGWRVPRRAPTAAGRNGAGGTGPLASWHEVYYDSCARTAHNDRPARARRIDVSSRSGLPLHPAALRCRYASSIVSTFSGRCQPPVSPSRPGAGSCCCATAAAVRPQRLPFANMCLLLGKAKRNLTDLTT